MRYTKFGVCRLRGDEIRVMWRRKRGSSLNRWSPTRRHSAEDHDPHQQRILPYVSFKHIVISLTIFMDILNSTKMLHSTSLLTKSWAFWIGSSCVHGIELSDSIKGGEFPDYMSDYKLVKKNSAPWCWFIYNKLIYFQNMLPLFLQHLINTEYLIWRNLLKFSIGYIEKMGDCEGVKWIELAQGRVHWRVLVLVALNHRI